jgi:hypothetical protein
MQPGVQYDFRHFADLWVVASDETAAALARIGPAAGNLSRSVRARGARYAASRRVVRTDAWNWMHLCRFAKTTILAIVWEGHEASMKIRYHQLEEDLTPIPEARSQPAAAAATRKRSRRYRRQFHPLGDYVSDTKPIPREAALIAPEVISLAERLLERVARGDHQMRALWRSLSAVASLPPSVWMTAFCKTAVRRQPFDRSASNWSSRHPTRHRPLVEGLLEAPVTRGGENGTRARKR